jgi:hypothetical protein
VNISFESPLLNEYYLVDADNRVLINKVLLSKKEALAKNSGFMLNSSAKRFISVREINLEEFDSANN